MCPFNDQRVALESAIYGADRSGVVAALVSQTWGDVLQLAGDGLVLALAQGVEGAPDLVRRCGAELGRWYVFSGERQRGRARAWHSAVGYSPSPTNASAAT